MPFNRSLTTASLVVIPLLTGACDDVASKEQKAEQTQTQADQQKAPAAAQQAANQTAAAWDAAAQQAEQAQAKADRAWDAASVAMSEERKDYAGRIDSVVADIDSKLTDLRASWRTTPDLRSDR